MEKAVHGWLTVWGSGLFYFAGMGAMLVASTPLMGASQRPLILFYVTLPAAIIGAGMIAMAHLMPRSD